MSMGEDEQHLTNTRLTGTLVALYISYYMSHKWMGFVLSRLD